MLPIGRAGDNEELFLVLNVSLPYLRRHAGRYALLVAGVSLGCALFLAMQASSRSLTTTFQDSVDALAGRAQLQVSAGGAGVPEQVLERLQALGSVERAVPAIEALVELKTGATVLILGLDLTGDVGMREYTAAEGRKIAGLDPLTFIAQPDSLLITAAFGQEQRVGVGETLRLTTMDGEKEFVVRGILPPGLRAFSGNVAIMDIYAAQQVFGRGQRFDRIDIRLRDGVAIEDGQVGIRAAAGQGFVVERPRERSVELEQLLRGYGLLQNSIAFSALLLGMAMIQSSFRLAVAQRFEEIGILRALGATRKQISSMFLWEGALVGLAGSALGIAVGLLLATFVAGYLTELLRGVLGAGSAEASSLPSATTIAGTLAVSLLACIAAAFGPSCAAARLVPAEAMRKAPPRSRRSHPARWAAAGLVALGLSAALPSRSSPAFYVSMILCFLGTIGLAPWLSLHLVRLARPVLSWLRPMEGAVAGESLIQDSPRTASTITILTIAFGQVIVAGGISKSANATLAHWVTRHFDQDLLVSGSPNLINRSFQFPAETKQQLESTQGVESVESVRQSEVRYAERTVLLIAMDLDTTCRGNPPVVVEGKWPGMCDGVAAGRGVVISESLAQFERLSIGDEFSLSAPGGRLALPIVGIVRDLQDPRGTVTIPVGLYRAYWDDKRIDKFRIFVKKGHDIEAVRERILRDVGSRIPLTIFTRADIEEFIFEPGKRQLNGSYAQITIAGIITALALMNLLAISVIERQAFLAVFRTLGVTRAGVRRILAIEALLAATVSILMGIGCGALCLRLVLSATYELVAGVHLEYVFPQGAALALVPLAACASVLAALIPAESVFRTPLAESLACD